MQGPTKLSSFRFTERDLAALGRIVDELAKRQPRLHGFFRPNRTEAIRWLIREKERQWEQEARAKLDQELGETKKKKAKKTLTKKGA